MCIIKCYCNALFPLLVPTSVYNGTKTLTHSLPPCPQLYNSVPGTDSLKKSLEDKLAEYNESNAVMELVLFQQAMEHVTRIARIIALPAGNAMLVGVGGSGKQSLARLASFICGYEVAQISVSSTYGMVDFKENWLALYTKAGMKVSNVFVFLDFGFSTWLLRPACVLCGASAAGRGVGGPTSQMPDSNPSALVASCRVLGGATPCTLALQRTNGAMTGSSHG